MGSNMAECHPVAFRWPLKAKTDHGAVLMHVDPRFTRTSALCDIHAPIRAGTDILFLGAIINHVINSKRWNTDPFFKEYVVNFTNAATLVNPDFKDTEDLDGLFSGLSPDGKAYSNASWAYQRNPAPKSVRRRSPHLHRSSLAAGAGSAQNRSYSEGPANRLPDHQEALQPLYPGNGGTGLRLPEEKFLKVAETLLANSGRDRTSNITYAVGWTQHTVGVQIIRATGMLQALLGNIGRPAVVYWRWKRIKIHMMLTDTPAVSVLILNPWCGNCTSHPVCYGLLPRVLSNLRCMPVLAVGSDWRRGALGKGLSVSDAAPMPTWTTKKARRPCICVAVNAGEVAVSATPVHLVRK